MTQVDAVSWSTHTELWSLQNGYVHLVLASYKSG